MSITWKGAATTLLMAALVACQASDRTPSALTQPASGPVRPARIGAQKALPLSLHLPGRSLALTAPTSGIAVQDMSDGVTAQQLAQALVGPGVTISNVTYTGAPGAAGFFASDKATLGITSGIILSTGAAKAVIGPNQLNNTTTDWGLPGDSQLSSLVGGTASFDASVLQFDFVPDSSTIYVSAYVFASEEYNEFVNSTWNDAMAFFVNGTNCALVGTQPVSINAINNGWPYGTSPNSHPELYRNNALPDGGGQINTEMDGLTRVLTCVAKVNKGVTNHIKLAVADVYDGLFDSNVFIGTGALTTVPPPPIPVPQARAVVTMTPDCVNGGMNVTLDGTSSSEPGGQLVSYQWFYGGITPVGTGPVVTFYRNPGASGPMSLVVTDTAGATARYDFQYTVTDPRQSTVSMSVAPGSIWPPNHKYVPVTVNAVFHPSQCGGTNSVAPTVGGYVESNQPDEANSGPNNGDGNFTDDIRVTRPDRTVLVSSNAQPRVPFNPLTDKLEVRAERSGANGGERVYTITMTANGTAVATSRVVVAHDQSGKH